MSADKSGSPPCGIYIRIDDFSNMPAIITALRQMALVINRTSGYEKNMCVAEFVQASDEAGLKERITDMVELAQAQGFVAVISGERLDFTEIMGADGVLLGQADMVLEARDALGDDAIIGLKCGKDRDLAQKAILLDADYVELTADPALVGWFKGLASPLLCCASAEDTAKNINADNCGALAHAGADLVNASVYILKHDKGVMQGAVNIQYALEMAAQTPGKMH